MSTHTTSHRTSRTGRAPRIRHPGGTARIALAAIAVAVLGLTVVAARPTSAQVSGGCSATIDGVDVNTAQNARDAIAVKATDTVVVSGTAPGPISSYQVYLTFGPTRFQVAEGTVTDGSTTWTETIDVADYAIFGVGLYRVEGDTTGTECTGWAYVKVTDKFPLFTVAGAVGGLLTLGGAAGMALSWPRTPKAVWTGGVS